MAEWLIVGLLALIAAYCGFRQWHEMTGKTRRRIVRKIKGIFA
jgi:hypothetical protein